MDDELLGRLADLEAIRALKVCYARFCDAGYDAEGIAGLFTEDGVWDGGRLFGRSDGREAIRTHFVGASSRIPWALHYVLCPEIDVAGDGEHATGTWYLWQPCQVRRGDRVTQAFLAGTYADTYRKVDGRWLFHTVVVDARWVDGPAAGPVPGA